MNTPPPLIDLLGARWVAEAPVIALAWDAKGRHAGFALGDGTLALAAGEWRGGPGLKPRQGGGGAEFVQPTEPPAPLARFSVHDGSCLALAADPEGGFLSGGDDGRLVHLDVDGTSEILADTGGQWIDLVAASRAGRAYTTGRRAHWLGTTQASLALSGSATALAFDHTGRQLAISHPGGVTLWPVDTLVPRLLAWPGYHRSLTWSPDGRYLVSGMEENALHGWRLPDAGDIEMGGYPGQPRSLSFSADGRFLVTSGGPRPVCWRFDPPGGDDQPRECGIAGKSPVHQVACHPTHPLIAVGYHNGAVLLCQPGGSDVLFIKGSGSSPIAAIAWSPDGTRLAFGTEAGELGLMSLPETLFHFASPR